MRLSPVVAALLMFVCAAAAAAQAAESPVIPPHPAAAAPPPSAATPPPSAAAPAANPVVARVNGIEIHRADVEAIQQNLPPEAQKLPFEQVFPVLLERLIDADLILAEGRKEHLENDPAVQARLKAIEDRVIEEAYVKREIGQAVTEDRLKARYQTWVKQQPARDEVHARHILVPTEAEAKDIIAQLNKGADFAALAKKYSKDRGGSAGGDLGYFTHDEMVPEFAAAAFALKPGEYTKTPVKTEFGWHVIKVEDRRVAPPPTFEQAHDQIAKLVANEVVEDKIKALRASAKIETFGPDGKKLPAAAPVAPHSATPKPAAKPGAK